MTPAIFELPKAVDLSDSLLTARRALQALAIKPSFRDYIARAIQKGPSDDLNRREREGESHFKILSVRGNGFETPHGTFLVLSIPHEAIGMPRFEQSLRLRVRMTDQCDGFAKTKFSRSAEFQEKLARCDNPAYLEALIVSAFGAV